MPLPTIGNEIRLPAALTERDRIANTVAVSFVDERERVIRQQQDSIRELSTPVLPVRERLLILPIIGVLDHQRARNVVRTGAVGETRAGLIEAAEDIT